MAVRTPDIEAERIPLTSISNSPSCPPSISKRKFIFFNFYSDFEATWKMLSILGPISNENLLNICMSAFWLLLFIGQLGIVTVELIM